MDLSRLQKAIRSESLDGWLFCNFRHRDPLADELLGISPDTTNTRQWFYFLPSVGKPQKIVHAIESRILDQLPGEKAAYASRAEMFAAIRALDATLIGVNHSDTLQVLSYLDHATARLLESAGFQLRSSAGLIQRCVSLVEGTRLASHERAASTLDRIVKDCWNRLSRATPPVNELDMQNWMQAALDSAGLIYDHGPLFAAGVNTSDPHYTPTGDGNAVEPDQVVQFDIWAREPDGIYADISWVGYTGSPPSAIRELFDAVVDARDHAIELIDTRVSAGSPVEGAEVDIAVRKRIRDGGYAGGLLHRTGHGIDTECHGRGVNLDGMEYPDVRHVKHGSLFSVEPGIYLERYGMRSEVNVVIKGETTVVTGGTPQRALLSRN